MNLLYLSIILMSSCSKGLVPVWFDATQHPEKYITLEADELTLIVESMETNGKHLVFDVEIRNGSSFPVQALPENMYYYGSAVPFPTETRQSVNTDFEKGLEKKYSLGEEVVTGQFRDKIRKQERTGIALGLFSAGLVVFDVIMDTKSFNDVRWTKKDAGRALARDLVTMTGLAIADMGQQHAAMTAQKTEADLFYIGNEILRPELIAPESSIRGKVFFPVPKEKYIKLIIPLGGIEYAFDFRWAEYDELQNVCRSR